MGLSLDRLGVTLVALAVFRLGTYIPLPGLEPKSLAQLFATGGPGDGRVSIFALGIMPLLAAFILVELLKLVAPDVRRWEHASPRNGAQLSRAVVGLAILMAIMQGAGVAAGLEEARGVVSEPGIYFRATCTLTLVAGTALVIALAYWIDRAGVGYGFWLLFLAPVLADLPSNLAIISSAVQEGQYAFDAVIRSALFSVFAIAAMVGIMLAARASPAVAAACTWPLLLAYSLLVWVLLLSVFFITGGDVQRTDLLASQLIAPPNPIRHLTLAALVLLIAWLYVRSNRAAGIDMPVPAAPIAVVLATIALAGEVLTSQYDTALPIGTPQLVIIAVVGTGLLVGWRAADSEQGPAEEPPEPLSPQA